MSEGTFYHREASFGGMAVVEVWRVKAVEDESAKLEKPRDRPLTPDLHPENRAIHSESLFS
jgi:hypothetical protein